ncbi:Acyltransferase LovD [Vanrija pseudolonga]|uniref:Acyltransferase LovD n=1 Tax=Vanrija pseudolonga TaxID=143232 RepID=A0AAF1BGI2_9TREE|nr:Acyltransferase LovD [Vanrija pseudolonga]
MTRTPSLTPASKRAIDALLEAAVTSREVNAPTAVVATADEILYFSARGERVYGKPELGTIDDQTVLQLFSCTKLITSVAVLQLVDAGKLTLDDPAVVDKYLPDLTSQPILQKWTKDDPPQPVLVPRRNPITVRQLLSHTGGVGYPFLSPELQRYLDANGIPYFMKTDGGTRAFKVPLIAEPGTRWAYGLSLDWAGILVERVTGLKLDAYFKQHIFDPLGLKLDFYATPEQRKRWQAPTVRPKSLKGKLVVWRGLRDLPSRDQPIAQLAGGAGIVGTAKDYVGFLQGVLRSRDGRGIISPAGYAELFKSSLPASTTPEGEQMRNDLRVMCTFLSFVDDAMLEDNGLDHSVGLVINTSDSAWGRKAGSGTWGGAAKTDYWIDPTSGIIAYCGVQINTDTPDLPFHELHQKFERAVYDGLQIKSTL